MHFVRDYLLYLQLKMCAMLKTCLLAIAILVPAILLMGMKVFFTRNGKFSLGHIGDSKEMRKRGIKCVQAQDWEERNKKTLKDRK